LADQSIEDDDKVTGFLKMGISMFRKQAHKPNCSSFRIKKAYEQHQMCRENKQTNKQVELYTVSFPTSQLLK